MSSEITYEFDISSITEFEVYSPAYAEVYTRLTNALFNKSYYSELELICDKCGENIFEGEEQRHDNCTHNIIQENELAVIIEELFNEGDNIIVITFYPDEKSKETKTIYIRKRENKPGD